MTSDSPPLVWRFATDEDAPEVVGLVRSAFRGEASRAGWTSEADLVEGERTDEGIVRRLLSLRGSRLLLARDERGSPVACCHIEVREQGLARLGMLAVQPSRQAAGIGRWLLGEAERTAVEALGARELEITVLAQQAALIDWYQRRGFRPTGETRPFPADGRLARALRDDLEFVVMRKPLRQFLPGS